MFRFLIVAVLLLGSTGIIAQDTLITFLDDEWKKTKEKEATYYKKSFKEGDKWIGHFHHISGELRMVGTYKKRKTKKGNGTFTYYYKNGQKEKQIDFIKKSREGAYTGWYKTGEKMGTGTYLEDKQSGAWSRWYKNGDLDSEGEYVEGTFNGIWKYYYKNGQMSAEENYHKGEYLNGQFWSEDGVELMGMQNGESKPEFPGGISKLVLFVNSTTKYPDEAMEKNLQGVVKLKYLVNNLGLIENVSVVKSVHPVLDAEAIRVINLSPVWTPGRHHNRPVSVWFTQRFNYELE